MHGSASFVINNGMFTIFNTIIIFNSNLFSFSFYLHNKRKKKYRTISNNFQCQSWLCKRIVKQQSERELLHFMNAKLRYDSNRQLINKKNGHNNNNNHNDDCDVEQIVKNEITNNNNNNNNNSNGNKNDSLSSSNGIDNIMGKFF